jgi:hypothetical protein
MASLMELQLQMMMGRMLELLMVLMLLLVEPLDLPLDCLMVEPLDEPLDWMDIRCIERCDCKCHKYINDSNSSSIRCLLGSCKSLMCLIDRLHCILNS